MGGFWQEGRVLASLGVPFDRLCDAWTLTHRIIDPQVAWKQTTMDEGVIFEKTLRLFGSMNLLVRFAFPGLVFPGLALPRLASHPTLWPKGAYTLSIVGFPTSTAGFLFRQGF